MKIRDAVEGFHLLENSHKLCRGFQQAMEARKTCFIPFIKLLFSVLIKRKMEIRSVYVYRLISFMLILTTWRQLPYCSRYFRASFVDQSEHYVNYFIT